MTTAKPKLKRTVFAGRINPSEVYTSRHLIEVIGVGRETLAKMRRAGLNGFESAGKKWYEGSDVIRFMRSEKQ